MTTLGIVVSDLHMGAGGRLDRFAYDETFRQFCHEVAEWCRDRGASLRFVLNGDLIDLWTTVPEDELGPGDTANIRRRLEYPATTAAKRRKAVRRGKKQINEILKAHRPVCEGLADLMHTPDPEVVYLAGNHDHGMMFPELQDEFNEVAEGLGGPWPSGSVIDFDGCYENEDLRLYVEHGQQFSADSRYEDFWDETEADMGLYFLRFVGNRVRYRYRDRMFSVFTELLAWTVATSVGANTPGPPPIRYLIDYFEARRDGLVPTFDDFALLRDLYQMWQANRSRSLPVLREALQDTLRGHPAPEYERQRVPSSDDIGTIRNVALPGTAKLVAWDDLADRYWSGAMRRFTADDPGFPQLDADAYSNIVLGHTHGWKYQFLPAPGVSSGRYFNSGSWTRGGDPVYMWVTDEDPRAWRGIKRYPTR